MALTERTSSIPSVLNERYRALTQVEHTEEASIKLSRWLVSFASGREWYPAGEFLALDAASAIERAIEIFGCASDCQAEEIPWDAAPLPKMNPPRRRL
jgi:hypothetical protein